MLGVEHQRARRDVDDEVFAVGAGHLLAHAAFAAPGFPVVLAGEVEERVLVGVGDEDDVPPLPPSPPSGPPLGMYFSRRNETHPPRRRRL